MSGAAEELERGRNAYSSRAWPAAFEALSARCDGRRWRPRT